LKQLWGVVLIVKLSAVEYVLTTQERCSGSLGVDPWLPRDVKIRPITPHFDTRDVFGLIAPHSLLTMCWLCIMHAVEAKPSLNPRIANIGDLISHLAVHCIDVCMSYWAGVFEFHTLVLYYFFCPFSRPITFAHLTRNRKVWIPQSAISMIFRPITLLCTCQGRLPTRLSVE
jgi:hypothetical protein